MFKMIPKFKNTIQIVKSYGIKRCLFNYFSILISDACVVSFRKSGRTWLRVMLAKILSLKHDIKNLGLEVHLMTLFKSAPNVFFSHGGSTANLDFRKLLKRKKIILLVRDPRDAIVSLFHNHTKRTVLYKEGISEFIRKPDGEFKKMIVFMNNWAEEVKNRKQGLLLIKYEDMQKDIYKELKKVLNFLNINVDDTIIDEAVRYGSFENMRKMETSGAFKDARMRPRNIDDENSYKTRKGRVGSYKEELNEEDISYLNTEIKTKLDPIFGY